MFSRTQHASKNLHKGKAAAAAAGTQSDHSY